MNVADIESGTRVQVIDLMERGHGLIVSPSFLHCRAKGVMGTVLDVIPGYEGAGWVRHDNGTVGAYWYFELVRAPPVESDWGGKPIPD